MLLALDAMGGDHGPVENCKGAIDACKNYSDLEIVLVGDKTLVEPLIDKADKSVKDRLHVVHSEEFIAMDESPAVAIRKKRHSSLRIAMQMVRDKTAGGCISAGNTGAIVAGGVLVVGRIPGIDRPGLGVVLPTLNRVTFMMDVGATVRCKPLNLYQFALMGNLYMKHIMGVEDPEIALLSNGSEEIKGDDVITAARAMLKESSLNFRGYLEGDAVPFGRADVVVCDGFTGNVVLKSFEGLGEAAYTILKDEMGHNILAKIGLMFMLPMLKKVAKRFDYEQYGGTPLLGVNGAVIKAHGRSKARAISSALAVARNFVLQRGVERIRDEIV